MSYFGIPIRNGLPIGLGSVAPLASGGGSPFSPLSLFSGGTPGAWYDPSDLTTLFQDSAGTTPVTAVEQPVGLMLDKSQGLVLGPELVVNGDFTSAAGWTLPGTGTNSITGGKAVLSGASGYLYRTNTSITAGRWYRVQFTVSGYSGSGTARPYLQASPVFGTNVTGNGTFSEYLLATTTSSNTEVGLNFASAFTASIDDVSIKELPGNHAFQSTSASRPVLSALYNLHTKTDFLSGANGWLLNGTPTITSDADVPAGQGFTNSTKIVTTGTFQGPYQNVTTVGTSNKKGVWLKGGAGGEVVGITDNGNTGGTVVLTTDWVFYTKTWTTVDAASGILISASGKTVYVAGVDVRSATQSSSLPAYQRVNTATDYATTGFLPYLKFDGVDDSLSTNSINFTSTDKMSVFAGVRKLSDAAGQILYELSGDTNSNNGVFNSLPGYSGVGSVFGAYWMCSSKGTTPQGVVTTATFPAPATAVQTQQSNISGDSTILRINGAQVAQSTSDQGTGNFGNYPLYIGRRNNASLPFNGQIYSLIIVGKAVTAGELSSTETYVAAKTGVTLPVETFDFITTDSGDQITTDADDPVIIDFVST